MRSLQDVRSYTCEVRGTALRSNGMLVRYLTARNDVPAMVDNSQSLSSTNPAAPRLSDLSAYVFSDKMLEPEGTGPIQNDEMWDGSHDAFARALSMSQSGIFAMMESLARSKQTRNNARKFVRELWLVQYDDEGDGAASQLRQDLETVSAMVEQERHPKQQRSSSSAHSSRSVSPIQPAPLMTDRRWITDKTERRHATERPTTEGNESSSPDHEAQKADDNREESSAGESDSSTPGGTKKSYSKARKRNLPYYDEKAGYQKIKAAREMLGEAYTFLPDPEIPIKRTRACKHCQFIPKFPRDAKKFKIVRSKCEHFLAVSYPCPTKETARDYKYRRQLKDDRLVPWDVCRPSDEAVDRAMDFARAADIRQIWIDQACIAQEGAEDDEGAEPGEHRLSIQAMDLVYQRAVGCVGLLEGRVNQQAWLDALEVFYHRSEGKIEINDPHQTIRAMERFLGQVADDIFNQRAWILQEGISASETMALAMRLEPGLEVSPQLKQDLPFPQPIKGTLLFTFDDLQRLMSDLLSIIDQARDRDLEISTASMRTLIQAFDKMHPRPVRVTSSIPYMHTTGG